MQKLKLVVLLFAALFLASCNTQIKQKKGKIASVDKERKEKIIEKYVYNCADTYSYHFPEYQACLDAGLKKDSTIAYLWQQKAMPYFKEMKYQVGMKYINKAVKYNTQRYLPYRAFIKCIFSKNYPEAIKDFKTCLKKYGNGYEMDHTYKFYIALSYLQLDEFKKAEKIFKEDIAHQVEVWNEAHYLDLFYYGISKFEQQKWKEAIIQFDRALKLYPDFSDVQYYKSIALGRIGNYKKAKELYKIAIANGNAGNTINEDNAVYERYPYQKRW